MTSVYRFELKGWVDFNRFDITLRLIKKKIFISFPLSNFSMIIQS